LSRSMISHPAIVSIHVVMMLLASGGFLAMMLTLIAIATYRVFQINLRLLLCGMAALIMMRSLSSAVRAAFFLGIFLFGRTRCEDSTWLVWRCQSYSIIIAGPGMATGYAFLGVAFERIIALTLGKKYEDSKRPLVGAGVTLVVWFEYLYTVISEWVALNRYEQKMDDLLPYCTSVSHHGVSVTTRLIIPCAVSYYILYMITLIGSFIASSMSTRGNMMLGTIIKEICSLAFNSYSPIFPAILLKREPGLSFRMRNKPLKLNEPPVSTHFD
ncbi:hypothetical protein PENTCL1PPCAC_8210, partial [Pristionchus entomophagus]